MLSRSITSYKQGSLRGSQRGVVLVIALIVLVIMTLAGIALMRSVDTANMIAGNLAFQQSATHAGDRAVEAAVTWLEECVGAHITCTASPPFGDDPAVGYSAAGLALPPAAPRTPVAGQTWDQYWRTNIQYGLVNNSVSLPKDAAGNTPSYIIDRLCQNAGTPTGGGSCAQSPLIASDAGQGEEAGELSLSIPSLVYYRITVRIVGPRNTVSYIQSLVAM